MEIIGYDWDITIFSSGVYDKWFWYHYKDKIAYEMQWDNKEYIRLTKNNTINACIIWDEVCLYLNWEFLHSVWTDNTEFWCNKIMELVTELEQLIYKLWAYYKTTINLSY